MLLGLLLQQLLLFLGLGRIPRRRKHPVGDDQIAENALPQVTTQLSHHPERLCSFAPRLVPVRRALPAEGRQATAQELVFVRQGALPRAHEIKC